MPRRKRARVEPNSSDKPCSRRLSHRVRRGQSEQQTGERTIPVEEVVEKMPTVLLQMVYDYAIPSFQQQHMETTADMEEYGRGTDFPTIASNQDVWIFVSQDRLHVVDKSTLHCDVHDISHECTGQVS